MSDDGPSRRHPRHRALARLDRLITRAEAAKARLLAGDVAGQAEIMLELAEERLALLRRSREALLADDGRAPPPADSDGTDEAG